MKRNLIPLAVLLLAATGTQAQTTLIDATTQNGSFELAGGSTNTNKISSWDAATDVDNWTEWTDFTGHTTGDSGVELKANATDGSMIGFMQPDNATYNLTSYTVQEGDTLTYAFDMTDRGSDNPYSLSFDLVYDDGGTITQVSESTSITLTDVSGAAASQNYSESYIVQAGDSIIGKTVGVGFFDAVNFPNFDNVTLTVTSVPEPGAFALIAGAMALGVIMIRRRKHS